MWKIYNKADIVADCETALTSHFIGLQRYRNLQGSIVRMQSRRRHVLNFSIDELSLALDLVEIFNCGFDFSAHRFLCECSGNKSSTSIVQPGTAGSASAVSPR